MARRKVGVGLGVVAVGAMIAGGLAWSLAQDSTTGAAPVNLLPGNSVLCVTFEGGAAHEEAFKKTAAYAALYESGLMEGLQKALDRAKTQAAQAGAPDQIVGTALSAAKHIMDRGLSFAIAVEQGQQGPPVAYGMAVLHHAAEFQQPLEALIKTALNGEVELETSTLHGREVTHGMIPNSPGVEVGWWIEGRSHIVLTIGISAVESALSVADGSAPNVTSNALYQKYSSSDEFEQDGVGFLDFAPLRKMFGGMPLPPLPDGRTITVNDFLKPLGLDSLNSLVWRSGMKGPACWNEAILDAPGPRTGLMALLDAKSFTIKDLPPLPPQLLNLVAVSVDGGKVYDTLFDAVKNIMNITAPEQASQIDQSLAHVEQELGFKLRDELFATVSGVASLYFDGKEQNFNAVGVAVQLSDSAKLKATLQKIFDRVNTESRGEVVFEKSTKMGRDLHVMRIRKFGLFTPTVCVDKKAILIGLMPQAIESALLRTDGKLDSWKPGPDHLAALEELPKEFTSLSISDTQAAYRNLLSAAPMMIGIANSALAQNSEFEFPLKPEDLPPAELVAQPLFPNITVSTVDDKGGRTVSRTSLPGLDVGSSAAVGAIGVALLLPAVQQAREAARRTQSKNNLHQMGLALHNYNDVYGNLPSGTVPNEKLKPEESLSWMYSILPFMDQAPLFNGIDADAAWDDDANEKARETVIPAYIHPSIPGPSTGPEGASTHYVGLAGIGEKGPTLPANDPKAGFFGYNRITRFTDITDGLSNTVAISESDGEQRPWIRGGESTIRPLTQQPYIKGPDGFGKYTAGGVNMLLGDGSVRFISENIDPSVMEALVTISGGEVVDEF